MNLKAACLPSLCVGFGALSLWQVFEMDAFWLLRAGDDILQTKTIPTTESWTYSALNDPWLNIHWLTEVLIRLMYTFGETAGLVAGRSILVALFIFLCAQIIASAASSATKPWLFVVLLPLIYIETYSRLELRGDTFVLLVFTLLIALWTRPNGTRYRLSMTLGLTWLAAQLHAGTAVFVLVVGAACMIAASLEETGKARKRPVKLALLASGVALLTCFATPVHFKILDILYTHFFYHDGKLLANPDHQALTLSHFNATTHGFGAWAFVAMTAMGLIGWWQLRGRQGLGLYSQRWLCLLFIGGITALCINRDRAFIYHAVLLLPCAARVAIPKTYLRPLALVSSLLLLPGHLAAVGRPFGFVVNPNVFPVESTNCLKSTKFVGNIYHTYTYGGYIVWFLRDHRHFGDPRETPFKKLEKRYFKAYRSVSETQRIYQDFDIQAVLTPVPQTEYIENMGYRDIVEEYNPRDGWALVCFDNISIGLIKRVPSHAQAIAEREYTVLRPNLPATLYAKSSHRTAERDALYRQELNRCLNEQPHNAYCNLAAGALIKQTDTTRKGRDTALFHFERAERYLKHEAPNTPRNRMLATELQRELQGL